MTCIRTVTIAIGVALALPAGAQMAHPTDEGPITLGDFSYFFAVGEWVEREGGTYIDGAMYA